MSGGFEGVPNPMEHGPAWQAIRDAVPGLQFGTVLITIHNGAIVQVEKSEKFRFPMASGQKHFTIGNID